MKDELMVKFSKAFYGGGSDYDKAVVAFEVADLYEAFGRPDVAHLYEKLQNFTTSDIGTPT